VGRVSAGTRPGLQVGGQAGSPGEGEHVGGASRPRSLRLRRVNFPMWSREGKRTLGAARPQRPWFGVRGSKHGGF